MRHCGLRRLMYLVEGSVESILTRANGEAATKRVTTAYVTFVLVIRITSKRNVGKVLHCVKLHL